ncbi:hypothetical protein LINGRAHAP2_LOCUS14508 [Linum grandiflorum]
MVNWRLECIFFIINYKMVAPTPIPNTKGPGSDDTFKRATLILLS